MGIFTGDANGYGGRDYDLYPLTTRELIREFSRAFGRPINESVIELSVSERELLGKLIFEECFEYVTKGLGLQLRIKCDSDIVDYVILREEDESAITLELEEGKKYDPVESADGLGDMNVVIHFNANWHGFNLDAVTAEIHDSNMSKLDEDGKPIINQVVSILGELDADGNPVERLIDPSKPVGKILKSRNFRKPDINSVLRYSEEMCPGHTASDYNTKVCRYCGIHVDSLRPPEDDFHD